MLHSLSVADAGLEGGSAPAYTDRARSPDALAGTRGDPTGRSTDARPLRGDDVRAHPDKLLAEHPVPRSRVKSPVSLS